MLTVLIRWLDFLRATAYGVRRDEEFRGLAISAAVLLLTGTVFYSLDQGWRLLDSFYFSVMTLTTVGYGDLSPTGDLARLFTVGYVLSGIGLFTLFIAGVARQSRQRKHEHRANRHSDADPAGADPT